MALGIAEQRAVLSYTAVVCSAAVVLLSYAQLPYEAISVRILMWQAVALTVLTVDEDLGCGRCQVREDQPNSAFRQCSPHPPH